MSEPARREWRDDEVEGREADEETPPPAPEEHAAQPESAPPASSTSDALENLERSLAHLESILDAPERRTGEHAAPPATSEVVSGLERVLAQFSAEARRLAAAADRLERRVEQLGGADDLVPPLQQEAPAGEQNFPSGGQPVHVVVAGVPGFQGLMDLQHRMSALDGVESASVVGYKDARATLELALRRPCSAHEIVQGVGKIEGQRLSIEESQPDELRLRLRFVDPGEDMSKGGSLRVEFRSSPPQ